MTGIDILIEQLAREIALTNLTVNQAIYRDNKTDYPDTTEREYVQGCEELNDTYVNDIALKLLDKTNEAYKNLVTKKYRK